MGKYKYVKSFSEFNGLDLRSSEVTRPRGFARESLNVMRGPTGSLNTRWGTKLRGKSVGAFGMWPYEATDMLSAAKSEILAAGSDILIKNHELYRQTGGTMTISNSGVAVTVSLYWDTATSQYRCRVVRAGVTLLNQALGTGLEAVPYPISDLSVAIDALSGINAPISGTGSQAAAFIDVIDDQVIANGGSYTCTFGTWTAVNRPRWMWKVETTDVSIANDTINLQAALGANGTVYNPLRDGDQVFWAARNNGVSACPLPFVVGTTYYVVSATNSTVKLAATSGGAALNITTTGANQFYLCTTTLNPGATFWNYAAELGQSTFRPVSSVQLRGARYFTAGRNVTGTGSASLGYRESAGLSKYDGQIFCRAGLPQYTFNLQITGTPIAAGTYTDCKGAAARTSVTGWDDPRYDFNYRYIDKIGNVIDGQLAGEFNSGTGHAVNGVLDLDLGEDQSQTILSRLGFNTNYGIVDAGASNTVSHVASDGCSNNHTLNVGDIAYFWDSRQSRFIQREVAGVVGPTLVFSGTSLDLDRLSPNYDDGLPPSIASGTAVSANMRIAIWRSMGVGTDDAPKYLVNEIPWCPVYSIYYDDKVDSSLGADLIVPAYVPSLPPPSRYIALFNSQLVSCGDDANPNTISFEDIETPEGMPLGTHSFDLPRAAKGVAQSGDVLVTGTDQKIHIVTGDLSQFKFRVQAISDNVGILAHESMRQVEEGLLFFESTVGPYALAGGTRLAPLGAMKYPDGREASRVEPYFTADYSLSTYQPAFCRAIGVVIPKDRLYILFVPNELPAHPGFTQRAADITTGSVAWVFDYGRSEWFRWTGVDFSACCVKDDTLYYAQRAYTGFGSGVDYTNLGSLYGYQVRNKGKYCYADHDLPLTWTFQPHWESLGKPGQFKRGIRCRISTEGLLVNPTPLTFKSYVDYDTALVSTNTDISWALEKNIKVKLGGETCRSIMVEFGSSQYYRPFSMSGFELELVADFREGFKE